MADMATAATRAGFTPGWSSSAPQMRVTSPHQSSSARCSAQPGRGTLNGLIPHPALVALIEDTADALNMPLQRSAHTGALTDASYVQFTGPQGVACLDIGFPLRYSHSALEVVDLGDLEALVTLLMGSLERIPQGMTLTRGPR